MSAASFLKEAAARRAAVAAQTPAPPPEPWTRRVSAVYSAHRGRIWIALAVFCCAAAWCIGRWLSRDAAHEWLRFPTLARSRSPDAHVAHLATDAQFPWTYSRLKPRELQPLTYHDWLRGLSLKSIDMEDKEESGVSGSAREYMMWGETLGDLFQLGRGGYTRCAQSSYALSVYYCGADPARLVHADAGRALLWRGGVDALKETIAAALDMGAQAVLEVDVHDDTDESFGHIFSLRIDPASSGVQPLMSFISQYTLGDYIRKHPKPVQGEDLREWLEQLAQIEAASKRWSPAAGAAYKSLFDAPMVGKSSSGTISVGFAVVCVIPPWNGTAADLQVAKHVEHVEALVSPILAEFSLR